jgi:hypothetical protein
VQAAAALAAQQYASAAREAGGTPEGGGRRPRLAKETAFPRCEPRRAFGPPMKPRARCVAARAER